MKRVYVGVNTHFDSTGFMLPTAIVWTDGRTFPIESVRDYRPADDSTACYTVLVRGQETRLFFERTDPSVTNRGGRWWVQR